MKLNDKNVIKVNHNLHNRKKKMKMIFSMKIGYRSSSLRHLNHK